MYLFAEKVCSVDSMKSKGRSKCYVRKTLRPATSCYNCIPGRKSGILCICHHYAAATAETSCVCSTPHRPHQIFLKFGSHVSCTKVSTPIDFGCSVTPFVATRGQKGLFLWALSRPDFSTDFLHIVTAWPGVATTPVISPRRALWLRAQMESQDTEI